MSYEAHVTDTAYCYDGSFAGFLCCVFESYARKEIPAEVCLNCTPFVRQYGILFRKWGVFVCQRDNESTTELKR